MSLTMSSAELVLLGRALAVAATPLAYADPAEWHDAVRSAIEPLLGTASDPHVHARDARVGARNRAARRCAGRAAAILDLVRPVLLASVATLVQRGARSDEHALHGLVDALPSPAALCAASGDVLHESPALSRLLDAEPMASRLRAAMSCAARTLAARKGGAPWGDPQAGREPWMREVRGGAARYELRGARLAAEPRRPNEAAALFLVRAAPSRPLSDAELHDRFRLTTREIEVLRLLAVGRSAREVAAELGLSYYTARHHVEHVLAKLGVRTRAAVAVATEA